MQSRPSELLNKELKSKRRRNCTNRKTGCLLNAWSGLPCAICRKSDFSARRNGSIKKIKGRQDTDAFRQTAEDGLEAFRWNESAAQRHRLTAGRPRRGEGRRPKSTFRSSSRRQIAAGDQFHPFSLMWWIAPSGRDVGWVIAMGTSRST